jgi:hypothetical protein
LVSTKVRARGIVLIVGENNLRKGKTYFTTMKKVTTSLRGHPFIHLLLFYLFTEHLSVPGTVPGAGNILIN